MERSFSVIIPTMFKRPDITNELLCNLYDDPAVSEVIIINNTEDPNNVTNINISKKLNVHSLGRNIYVNPAWNLGVSKSKSDFISLVNDDITIAEGMFTGLSKVPIETLGVIGVSHGSIVHSETPKRFISNDFMIRGMPERTWGFGVFMTMYKKNYAAIPEDLLVWCGDDYIYHKNRVLGKQNCVLVCPIETTMSSTSNDSSFDEIKDRDVKIYNSKYKV
jgi:hypothetical protein